ncbi:CotS family spore coat protein [Tumebacillus permanentifrigoris]|uniref:CotS family spore coat protein n=1 Tax=Tumebacillus permanentifrigoris TaxID=378543 RepID=A0A316DDT5_9BACL|nr:CotS family spore coat protein [Tumebacillus permanentifrigoris]PWK13817.1 CotS family spore coat protein [Tumebacillus permanentifrigoris]
MADNKKSSDIFKNLWEELTKPPKWMKEGKKSSSSSKKKDDGKKDEADASSTPKKRQPPSWWSWSTSDGVPAKPTPKESKKKKRTRSRTSSHPTTHQRSRPNSKPSRSTQTSNLKPRHGNLAPLAQSKSDLGSPDHDDSLSTVHSMIRRHGFSPASLKAYGITATKVEPFGPVLRLRTSKGLIALKKTELSPKQVQFLHESFLYLESRKFTRYAPFVLSTDGLPYVQVGGETYYATQWVRGQEVDFRSMPQLALTARTLADFHEASRGYEPKGYRPAMIFDLVDRFQDRRDEFNMWKKRAKAKSRPDEVDKKFLRLVDAYIAQADQALTVMKRPNVRAHLLYEEDDPPLCHLDLTPYNMVYTTIGQVCLIDLDFCTYGPRTLDLAHLVRRALQRADWEEDVLRHALVNYNAVRLLTVAEYVLLYGLLVFPHRFWRISYQHYEVGHDPHHMGYYELAEAEETKRQAFLKKFGQQVDRMRR